MKSIYGIRLQHDGCITEFSNGIIEKFGFKQIDYGDEIAFYPKKGDFIEIGSGILFEIDGDVSISCLTSIIIVTDGGFTLTSDYNKVYGCMNDKACNYDKLATIDDGACELAQKHYDCSGNCLRFDECGICGGDNSSCADCLGIPNGTNKVDMCNVCDDNPDNDCAQDCAGIWGGESAIDECEICIDRGYNNLIEWNKSCQDCKGVIIDGQPGPNYIDKCGVCDADYNNDCTQDCAGIWGGKTIIDECGICGGEGIAEGRCDCEGTIIDCMGICGGNSQLDRCGVCNGDNKSCGATYKWPTNASKTVTAFFGEERPRRYHAGIDIRTYGRNGYELYAISDGYIKRVRTSSEGYGKAIYLQLNDGNLAVYAHLEKFTPEVDFIVKQLQTNYNSYTLDHTFKDKDLTFKKGEIIGYTGDTGSISGPHLHFEIRNKDGLAINPLHEFSIYDKMAPIPESIAFIPYDENSKISGYNRQKIYPIIKKDNTYTIKDTIGISGYFGLALNAIDKIDKQPFDYGLYSIELFIDSTRVYNVKYDVYDFSESKYIYCERDFGLKKDTGKTYYRLYANNNNETLFFVGDNSLKKMNIIDDKYHQIKIKIEDFNGNSTQINGTIINKNTNHIKSNFDHSKNTISFEPILETDTRFEFVLSGKHRDDKQFLVDSFSIDENELIIPNNIEPPFNILEIIPKNNNGLAYNSQFIDLSNSKQKIDDIEIGIEQYKQHVLLKINELNFSNSTSILSKKLLGEKLVFPLNRFDKNTFISNPFSYYEFSEFDTILIEFDSNPEVYLSYPMNQKLVVPDKEFDFFYNAKELILNGYKDTFYDSTIIWAKSTDISYNKNFNGTIVAGPYFVGPDNVPFNKKVYLFLSVINPELIRNSGIYNYNEKKETWYYMESTVEKNNMIKTYLYSGGIFAVIKENTIPKIYNIYPSHGSTYYQKDVKHVSFNVKDELSGINGEKDIELRINDGKPIIFEYNSYQNKVYYKLDNRLEKGTHSLIINAFDKVGNQNTKIIKFNIK